MSNTFDTYQRQMGILNPDEISLAHVTLIGAGGIGSPTALALAKMGIPRLTVFDPDTLEEHNIPNQMYPSLFIDTSGGIDSSLGHTKVWALARVLEVWAPATRFHGNELYYEDGLLSGIVVSAVDSMATRAVIWKGVVANKELIPLYVDARMGAEVVDIITVHPQDAAECEWYEMYQLGSDAEAMELPCTARAIIYNTMMASSLVCRQVKAHLTGQSVPSEIIFDLENVDMLKVNAKLTEEVDDEIPVVGESGLDGE